MQRAVATSIAAIAVAAALAAGSPGAAQSLGFGRGNSGPIHIEADEGIEWQRASKLYIARGNARASQGDVTVEADELVAYYRPGAAGTDEIYRIDANGDVRILSDSEVATSDKAVYDVIEGVLVMTGRKVRLDTPKDTIVARDSLEYYEDKQLAIARGDALAIRDDRRVRADTLMAHFAAGENETRTSKMERIEAIGDVVVSTKTDIVRAKRGDYRPERGFATVTGDVRITRGNTQLNGDRAEVNLNTGKSRLLAAADGGSGKQVRGLFLPSAPRAENTDAGTSTK